MTPSNLQTEDTVVQQVRQTLDNHLASMRNAAQNVVSIKDDIQRNFQAACSTQYQQKIDDWEAKYRQLQDAYQGFQEKLSSGHRQIDSAHNDALETGSSWSAGDQIYQGLGG